MKRLTLVSLMLVGCGGSDLDPGAGNDPGTGTSTLAIEGEITARGRIPNSRHAEDFDTNLSVRVMLDGLPMTTGTVTVTSQSGSTPLAYSAESQKWRGVAAGYDEVYVVDAETGSHNVQGVRVDGPDIHIFTAPSAGANIDSTMPLPVAWASDQDADSTSIDCNEIDRLWIADTGQYTLAPGVLKAERETARENTIELVRSNRVVPAGAVAGSDVQVSIENRIQVVALPNPAL